MKTALLVNVFLHGQDERSQLTRVQRVMKYLRYYHSVQGRLGISAFYVTDNGGTEEQIWNVLNTSPDINLIRRPHLQRGEGHPVYDNLPNWRALYDIQIPIQDGFEKVIVTDDDAYILSSKMFDYVKNINSGWETFWCPRWNMPEASISVLCKDTFQRYLDFVNTPYEARNKSGQMEFKVPYGPINKSFNIDRWGEDRRLQEPGMDAYCQCPADITMTPEEQQHEPRELSERI